MWMRRRAPAGVASVPAGVGSRMLCSGLGASGHATYGVPQPCVDAARRLPALCSCAAVSSCRPCAGVCIMRRCRCTAARAVQMEELLDSGSSDDGEGSSPMAPGLVGKCSIRGAAAAGNRFRAEPAEAVHALPLCAQPPACC